MSVAAPIGEVVLASTTQITAQCIELPRPVALTALPQPPAFGSIVRIGRAGSRVAPDEQDEIDPFLAPPAGSPSLRPLRDNERATIYAVVFRASVGPIEAGRAVSAFGLEEAALLESQPQIYELLAASFSALYLGYCGEDGAFRPYLPPRPPTVHSFVWPATPEETRTATARLDYLRGLLAGGGGMEMLPDELVAALLRNAAATAYPGDPAFILRAGREVARLLPLEYDRLAALLKQIAG